MGINHQDVYQGLQGMELKAIDVSVRLTVHLLVFEIDMEPILVTIGYTSQDIVNATYSEEN